MEYPGQILRRKEKRKKLILTIVSIIAVIIIFIVLMNIKPSSKLPTKACFNGRICVNIELALTEEQQKIGLMNRANLSEDAGMLFVYKDMNLKKFWMKNTLIPLDIIWMDNSNRIIYIERNAQPCTRDPCDIYGIDALSKDVLEVNGGFATKNNLLVGDIVLLK